MALIDTHCHLDLDDFDQDRRKVLENTRKSGVCGIVIPGVNRVGWPGLVALCDTAADLYPALGLHPFFVEHHQPGDLALLQQLIERHQPVAVGEIGLDFYRPDLPREKQLTLFEQQLAIARVADLPVILHNRKAHDQMLSLLKKNRVKGGICHAFNGSFQQAQQYIDLGFKLGFGGMLTYERSTRLRKLAAGLPIDSIVLETDAPDMPPPPTGISVTARNTCPKYWKPWRKFGMHQRKSLRGRRLQTHVACSTCLDFRARTTVSW